MNIYIYIELVHYKSHKTKANNKLLQQGSEKSNSPSHNSFHARAHTRIPHDTLLLPKALPFTNNIPLFSRRYNINERLNV